GLPVLPSGNPIGSTFTVDPDTTQDVTLTITVGDLLGLGNAITVSLEAYDEATGTWAALASYNSDNLLSLLGSGGTGNLVIPDLPEGDYRVRLGTNFGLLSVAGNVTVDVSSTVTHLDTKAVNNVFAAEGNLF